MIVVVGDIAVVGINHCVSNAYVYCFGISVCIISF